MKTAITIGIAVLLLCCVGYGIGHGLADQRDRLSARESREEEHLKATKLVAEALQDLDRRVKKLEGKEKAGK